MLELKLFFWWIKLIPWEIGFGGRRFTVWIGWRRSWRWVDEWHTSRCYRFRVEHYSW